MVTTGALEALPPRGVVENPQLSLLRAMIGAPPLPSRKKKRGSVVMLAHNVFLVPSAR
jgi:hypothetical protein